MSTANTTARKPAARRRKTSKPTQKRWLCPDCGAGILAPSRMTEDDSRRYCLDCSKASPKLVRRYCPALDQERARKAAAAAAKRQAKKQRQAKAAKEARSVAGVDIEAEWTRLCRLPSVRKAGSDLDRRVPTLTLRRTSRQQGRTVSVNGWERRVVVSVWPGRSAENVCGWLLWALAAMEEDRVPAGRLPASSRRARIADLADEAYPDADTGRTAPTENETVELAIAAITNAECLYP